MIRPTSTTKEAAPSGRPNTASERLAEREATHPIPNATQGARRNYTVKEIQFRLVREPGARDPRLASGPADVVTAVQDLDMIPDDAREHFVVLFLNAQNRIVGWHHVSTGTLSASLVHPREVFGPALRMMGVASLILLHNHPSGDPTPSREDIRLTRQLVESGHLLDLPIHDHVILGSGTDAYASLSEKGLL